MTMEHLLGNSPWPWVFAGSLAVATWSLCILLARQGVEAAWRLHRRRGARKHGLLAGIGALQHGPQDFRSWAPLLVSIPMAAFLSLRSPFLAACFIALGLLLSRYLTWRRSRAGLSQVSAELERMVTALHSAYLVRPVVASALEEAARSVQGPLREAVERALRGVWVGGSPKEAYASLGKAVGSPYLAQLGLVLERAEECSPMLVGEALKDIAGRLKRRKRLQARVKASMSMLAWTVRFLQGANALAVVIVLATPSLRDFYIGSFQRQGLFAIALAAVLGASLYFDHQLASLRERVL
ncbi:MAG: hypothetical protein EPO21_03920 [Chloroflexota bacterium]|nr:MAG: hypothetical protein EPO21_03920 [Chloroflexota bacterium]